MATISNATTATITRFAAPGEVASKFVFGGWRRNVVTRSEVDLGHLAQIYREMAEMATSRPTGRIVKVAVGIAARDEGEGYFGAWPHTLLEGRGIFAEEAEELTPQEVFLALAQAAEMGVRSSGWDKAHMEAWLHVREHLSRSRQPDWADFWFAKNDGGGEGGYNADSPFAIWLLTQPWGASREELEEEARKSPFSAYLLAEIKAQAGEDALLNAWREEMRLLQEALGGRSQFELDWRRVEEGVRGWARRWYNRQVRFITGPVCYPEVSDLGVAAYLRLTACK